MGDEKDAFLNRIAQLSPTKLALLALELNDKLEAAKTPRRSPIAVVGMGCRMPGGVANPDAFWELLKTGTDAIEEVPRDRWDVDALYDPDPQTPGKMASRWGGFVGDVSAFDPQFFGIAPREAASLDPQQRLLLEVVWEALENSGRAPDSLHGSHTGVFLGISSSDYFHLLMRTDPREFDVYLATGVSHSVASGRLAYLLGLNGPAVSVDTACSSSLVSIHLACESLLRGECDLALAGGVNVILIPEPTVAMSRSGMMAPDGRCKAFDASANGFVRSEGCGMIVLKRLEDAVRDGDRVLSVILGSATNQDGRSNGLTAPNGPSQRAVIRAALESANVAPSEVGFVEAHGTGTSLGDPIEVAALGAELRVGRTADRPVFIGTAKANLGHLEAAAGITGVIKTVMMLQHGQIPPQIHFKTPSPYIDWENLPIAVPTALASWPEAYARRIAGVSSFGLSGTNAHIILAEAPAAAPSARASVDVGAQVVCLSADDPTTLATLARRYADRLGRGDTSLLDFAYTASAGRAHRSHRLAIVADSAANAARLLRDADSDDPQIVRGVVDAASPPKIAFLFTGQGAQYAEMGRKTYDTEPVFRAQIDRCDAIVTPMIGRSLVDLLFAPGGGRDLEHPPFGHVALFSFEYALASLWRSWGVEPDVMMGHSLGEYVAACLAGVLSLEDSLGLVYERGRLSVRLPETGAMFAIGVAAEALAPVIAPLADRVSIAAVNGPQNTVISGDATTVRAIARDFADRGHRTHELPISRAFHSIHVDAILDDFERFAARLNYGTATHQLISNVTGELATDELGTPGYWRRHLRQAVQFAPAMRTLRTLDCNVFIEIGPHPVLSVLGQHCMPDGTGTWLSTMHRERDERAMQLDAVQKLYASGVAIDWDAWYARSGAKRIGAPTYPFKRSRHWIRGAEIHSVPARPFVGSDGSAFPGARVDLASGDVVFDASIGVGSLPFLRDHSVYESLVVPAPMMMELGRSAVVEVLGSLTDVAIEDFVVSQPLVLTEDIAVRLQTLVTPASGGVGATFEISSSSIDGSEWTRHATGRCAAATSRRSVTEAPAAIQSRLATMVDGNEYYRDLEKHGVEFGPAFRAIQRVWRVQGEALSAVRIPDGLAAVSRNAPLHPVLVDSLFQTLGAALNGDGAGQESPTYLMVGFDRFTFPARTERAGWCHATLRGIPTGTERELVGDVRLVDDAGVEIARAEGLRLRRAPRSALLGARVDAGRSLYEVEWVPCETDAMAQDGGIRSPRVVADAVRPLIAQVSSQYALDDYAALVAELESLSIHYVTRALDELGVPLHVGARLSAASVLQRGVLPRYARLVARLLEMLTESGVVAPAGTESAFIVEKSVAGDLDSRVPAARERFAAFHGEIDLLDACGRQLGAVLRGTHDPLQILFPGGSMARVEALTQSSPAAQAFNGIVADVVRAATAEWPASKRLRILEIGAGTGGTTVSVLEAIAGRAADYAFTDVSPLFLARAADKFAGDPRIEYERLDIENPGTSRLAGRQFDLIIAANVIHATMDLRASLENIKTFMAPGAVLVLLEGVMKQRWVDLTFGLTEGWWRFNDDRRANHPLLTRDAWSALLRDTDLGDAAIVPSSDSIQGALERQAVIVVRSASSAATVGTAKRFTIVADEPSAGAALADVLGQRGFPATPIGTSEIAQVLQGDPTHIVYVASTPATAPTTADEYSAAVERSTRPLLDLIRTLVEASPVTPPRIWAVTRGAQPGFRGSATDDVSSAPVWGLGRTIATEHPECWGGLVDVDVHDANVAAVAVADALTVRDEDELCVRDGQVFAGRLRRMSAASQSAAPSFSRDGTYLITGGLRGIGLQVARWLVENGAGHVVLVARRAVDDAANAVIEQMRASGATLTIRNLDIGDEPSVRALVAEVRTMQPPLRGVMHVAGIFDDRTLIRQDWARFERVLSPKVRGGWLLDRLTADIDLDFFVLFASGASLLGPVGLANYAAANAFVDALAQRRRRNGRPGVSIDWGPWAKLGMADAVGEHREQQWSSAGFSQMSAAKALGLLGRIMHEAPGQVAAFDVEWDRYLAGLGRRVPLFANFAHEAKTVERATTASLQGPELPRVIADTPPERRWDLLISVVDREVRHVLGFQADDALDPQRGLFDVGLDSLTAVELKNRLQRALGQTVPATVVFDHSSVSALARYIAKRLDVVVDQPVAAPVKLPVAEQANAFASLSTDELAARLSARLHGARGIQ